MTEERLIVTRGMVPAWTLCAVLRRTSIQSRLSSRQAGGAAITRHFSNYHHEQSCNDRPETVSILRLAF